MDSAANPVASANPPRRRRSPLRSRLFLIIFSGMGLVAIVIFGSLATLNFFMFRSLVFERNRAASQSLTAVIVGSMRHSLQQHSDRVPDRYCDESRSGGGQDRGNIVGRNYIAKPIKTENRIACIKKVLSQKKA